MRLRMKVAKVAKMILLKILINRLNNRISNKLISIIVIIENQILNIKKIEKDILIRLENTWIMFRITLTKKWYILIKELIYNTQKILTIGINSLIRKIFSSFIKTLKLDISTKVKIMAILIKIKLISHNRRWLFRIKISGNNKYLSNR